MLEFEIYLLNCYVIMASVGVLVLVHSAAGIRTPPQSNMPIKGNPLKTSFQDLEINYWRLLQHDVSVAHHPKREMTSLYSIRTGHKICTWTLISNQPQAMWVNRVVLIGLVNLTPSAPPVGMSDCNGSSQVIQDEGDQTGLGKLFHHSGCFDHAEMCHDLLWKTHEETLEKHASKILTLKNYSSAWHSLHFLKVEWCSSWV